MTAATLAELLLVPPGIVVAFALATLAALIAVMLVSRRAARSSET